MDKEEAKKRMYCKWSRFASTDEVLEALLDKDPIKLDAIIAMKARVAEYNLKMEADIDAADEKVFENMVNTFTAYQDK